MRNALISLALLLAMTACSDDPGARRVLEHQGYRGIETTGYSWFGCGEDDIYATGFKALSASGDRVEGVVCKGVFKGSTVREN